MSNSFSLSPAHLGWPKNTPKVPVNVVSVFQPSPLTIWKLQEPAYSPQAARQRQPGSRAQWAKPSGSAPKARNKAISQIQEQSLQLLFHTSNITSCSGNVLNLPSFWKANTINLHLDLLCSASHVLHFRLAQAEEVGKSRLGKGHKMHWF